MAKGEVIFIIDYPGEDAAGLRPFTDRLTIDVESGDFGGEVGEFADYIRETLVDWYDGATVLTVDEYREEAKKLDKYCQEYYDHQATKE